MIALECEGIVSKVQPGADRVRPGGRPFARGALYHLLTNRTYRGEVVHRGEVYPGEQEAIVPQELWGQVQAQLGGNGVERRLGVNARDPSLLVGRIRDGEGRRMTPSHAVKGSLRYRYYVSVDEQGDARTGRACRVAAGDIETAIVSGLKALLDDQPGLIELLGPSVADAGAASAISVAARLLRTSLDAMPTSALRDVVEAIGLSVIVGDEGLNVTFSLDALARRLGIDAHGPVPGGDGRRPLPVSSTIIRRGHELRLTVAAAPTGPIHRDGRLITLLLKAEEARRQLFDGPTGAGAGAPIYSDKHLARMARLAFLAPDIVAAILDGRQPKMLTARRLLRTAELPLAWSEQRRMFGFA
jgi:hypothetical protein